MHSRSRALATCAAFLLLLPTSAMAKPKPITGKLSVPGYTVLAVAKDGEASSAESEGSKFKLRPPAKKVSVHLRAADGTYAGPVVLAKADKGRRAVLGVRAGAKLAKVKVKGKKGYARPDRNLRDDSVDYDQVAKAEDGVPIGAGNFGLVRVKKTSGPRNDADLDGIPVSLDIDDDGDLVLDNLELPTGSSLSARRQGETPPLAIGPTLAVPIEATANANAAGLDVSQADTTLQQFGRLGITSPVDAPELDCGGELNPAPPPTWSGGLSYCTPGGTGGVFGTSPEQEFPECCDGDGDGLGTVVHVVDPENDGVGTPIPAPAGPAGAFVLRPHATTTEIQTGDLLVERATSDGVDAAYPATLQYVFATNPALISFSDTAGNSATVDYPVRGPASPAGPGLGARGNGFPVGPGADGHIRATFTFWRPQRQQTPGDPGEGTWMDIGGLIYTLGTGTAPCSQAAYSTADPSFEAPTPGSLVDILGGGDPGAFIDRAADMPADPRSTLSFTVDLTDCLASSGRPFNSGDEMFITLQAIAGGAGVAEQQFWIERQ